MHTNSDPCWEGDFSMVSVSLSLVTLRMKELLACNTRRLEIARHSLLLFLQPQTSVEKLLANRGLSLSPLCASLAAGIVRHNSIIAGFNDQSLAELSVGC